MSINKVPLAFLNGVSLVAICTAWPAVAQTAPVSSTEEITPTTVAPAPVGTSAASVQADTAGTADIVVTAQKRSESLSKVGLTISAFSGDTLRSQGLASVQDLTKVVPGLTFATGLYNNPVYTLRGVGFYDTSLAAFPAVTVYVDQVPLVFPALTTQAGLDLERVEVLKGPQGTLFGQNSTGGAINYVAAKPTSELHAGVDASYGRFDDKTIGGFISGPIANNLTGRIAMKLQRSGPWQRGYTADTKNGRTRTFAGRILLRWEPSDYARFNLSANRWTDRGDPQASQFYLLTPQSPNVSPQLANYPVAPRNARAADITPGYDPRIHANFNQAALNSEFDLSDDITLTSITSYVDYKHRNRVDPDGMTLEAYNLYQDRGRITSFSQEARIANSSAASFRWIVGGNFDKHDVNQNSQQAFGDSTVNTSFGFDKVGYFADQKIRNYAFFANGEYDLSSKLTAKAGVRYTNLRTKYAACTYDVGDGLAAGFFSATSAALRGAFGLPPAAAIAPGSCTQLSAATTTAGGAISPNSYLGNRVFNDRLKENNVSWRGGLDYKVSAALLLYANVAKGYKSGGFPQVVTSSDSQYAPVTQESVIDYEAGFKAQLLDRTLSLNGAAFYYSYRNKQLRGKVLDPIFGALDQLQNIPKSTLKGGEVSIVYRPDRALTLSAAGTYVDGKIKQFEGVNGAGVAANFAGSPIPLSPKWQLAFSADYRFPLSAEVEAFAGTNASYNSKTFGVIGGNVGPSATDPDPANRIKGYALLDVRAGINLLASKLSFTIWGKNITNTYYWFNSIQIYDQKVRYAGRPATYGGTISYRY